MALIPCFRHCTVTVGGDRQLHCAGLPVAGCVNAGGGWHRERHGHRAARGPRKELMVHTIEPVKIEKIEGDAIRRGSRRVLRLEGNGGPAR